MENNEEMAGRLFGAGWHDLPEFVRDAAANFVPELLDTDGDAFRSDAVRDRAHECADAAVPVYRSELLALLADPSTANAIFWAADELGGLDAAGLAGDTVTQFVSLGCYGLLSNALGMLLSAVDCGDCWEVFGLDADAAEVAAALWSEWSGTVAELVAAAPRLAVAR